MGPGETDLEVKPGEGWQTGVSLLFLIVSVYKIINFLR